MANKRALWNKAGRFFTAVVVLCFFLPFFGVSCNGMEIVTVSGADMVGGCKPGGMIADMGDKPGMSDGPMSGELKGVDREPLAIAAMVLAIALFGLAWLRTRQALLGSTIVAALGLAALIGLFVQVNGKMGDMTKLDGGGDGAMKLDKDVKVDAGSRYGLWLTAAGFIGIAYLTATAMREPEPPAGAAAPPLPPPASAPPPPA